MGLAAGTRVTENITLVRLLGQGGMGSVWLARHQGLDLDVAVKFVATELLEGGDPVIVARFRREAQLAAKLDSPFIVRTLDHGVTEAKVPYIVMELLRGESLADRLQREHTLSPAASTKVVREIASALVVAHGEGVVHRDIKPHNVFLARAQDGTTSAKILDFGIAKAADSGVQSVATQSGVLLGTPQYMSPEQLMRAGPVDKGVDLWALAVTAYEMLLGRLPFRGETLAATLVAITRADLVAPSSIDRSLPPALDAWFSRALAIDPDRRFDSADELATAYGAALEGITTSAMQRPPRIELVASSRPDSLGASSSDSASSDTASFVAENAIDVPASRRRGAALAPTMLDGKMEGDGERSAAVTRLVGPDAPSTGEVTRSAADLSREAPPAVPLELAKGDSAVRAAKGDAATVMSAQSPELRARSAPGGWSSLRIAGGVALLGVVGGAGWALSRPAPIAPTAKPHGSVVAVDGSAAPSAARVDSSAAASAPSASAVPSVAKLGSIAKTTIASGYVAGSEVWMPEFSIVREAGDEDVTFAAAERACERRSLAVCTESQWARACGERAEIATMPSWTATADPEGVLVRGGESCSTRVIAPADSHDPGRAAICCSRAVGVSTETRDPAFLSVTSGKLLEYERVFDAGDGARAAALMSEKITYYGRELGRDEAGDIVAWSGKKQHLLHDRCNVALTHSDAGTGWTAECEVLMQGGGVFLTHLRYVRGGPQGLLEKVVEQRSPLKLAGPEAPVAPGK